MRISDWSSDVCSSDLRAGTAQEGGAQGPPDAEARGAALSHPARLLEPRRRDPRPLLRHRHHRRGREAARATFYREQTGRASCRDRVCQYVEYSVVTVTLKKKSNIFKFHYIR